MLQLFDQRIARLAAIMVAVVPNMIFWSVSQVKDPLIIFSTFSIIYILICKLHSGRLALYFIPYCAFMYMLWYKVAESMDAWGPAMRAIRAIRSQNLWMNEALR